MPPPKSKTIAFSFDLDLFFSIAKGATSESSPPFVIIKVFFCLILVLEFSGTKLYPIPYAKAAAVGSCTSLGTSIPANLAAAFTASFCSSLK